MKAVTRARLDSIVHYLMRCNTVVPAQREEIIALLRSYPLPAGERERRDEAMAVDPRGAPAADGYVPPIVVEKHRHSLDGAEQVSCYACGPVRATVEEALADARRFHVPAMAEETPTDWTADQLRSMTRGMDYGEQRSWLEGRARELEAQAVKAAMDAKEREHLALSLTALAFWRCRVEKAAVEETCNQLRRAAALLREPAAGAEGSAHK